MIAGQSRLACGLSKRTGLAFAAFLALSGIRLLTLKLSRADSGAPAQLEQAGAAGRRVQVETSR